ncbi:hypothetical protein PTKIN_Ptkin04bG0068700 [Pterospermum kingtungense]
MDTRLTTIGMETTAMKQVWSSDCYSFNEVLTRPKIGNPSPPLIWVNGTTKTKTDESFSSSSSSSTEMIVSLCGIILSVVILNLVIKMRDFYSSFHCVVSMFKSFLQFLSCSCTSREANSITTTSTVADQFRVLPRDHETESNDHRNLSILELRKMIEGISLCNLLGTSSCETQENLSADKIAGVFEEEEPSLKEVKEAFDMFDENKDGFIDAKELGNVLFSLGFIKELASEEECKRMIKVFDENLDGRIDFNEFIKVMERSFC